LATGEEKRGNEIQDRKLRDNDSSLHDRINNAPAIAQKLITEDTIFKTLMGHTARGALRNIVSADIIQKKEWIFHDPEESSIIRQLERKKHY